MYLGESSATAHWLPGTPYYYNTRAPRPTARGEITMQGGGGAIPAPSHRERETELELSTATAIIRVDPHPHDLHTTDDRPDRQYNFQVRPALRPFHTPSSSQVERSRAAAHSWRGNERERRSSPGSRELRDARDASQSCRHLASSRAPCGSVDLPRAVRMERAKADPSCTVQDFGRSSSFSALAQANLHMLSAEGGQV